MSLPGIFERVGCQGFVHATTLDGRHEVALGADEPVVPASVIKVLVALVETRIADGRLDATERVRVTAAERTPGPTGMALFADDVELSLRDLGTAMLTISDNVATDVLIARVGTDAVNATAGRLGLGATHLGSDLRTLVDSIGRDAGFDDYAALAAWTPAGPGEAAEVEARVRAASALSPHAATRTTARDMSHLLRLLWADRAGPPEACGRIRDLMARQLTRHRIAAGFGPEARVAAKSGGLMGVVRNEVGVVTFPGEPGGYAVAVFTRDDSGRADGRAVDAAVGEVAAAAVDRLQAAALT